MKAALHGGILLLVLAGVACQHQAAGPQALPDHAHAAPEAGTDAGIRRENPAVKPPEVGVHEVSIRNFIYEPASLSIRVGESVRWTNYDVALHDAAAYTGSWKTPLLKVNESATRVFGEPGVFPYYCTIHPAMRGTVEVK